MTDLDDDLRAALALYRRAFEADPADRDTLLHYGNLLYVLGSYDEAETLFCLMTKHHAADPKGWINLGLTRKARGLFPEAEQAYRQAMAIGTPADAAHARFNLANLLLGQGRWREGFAAFEARRALPGAIAAPWGLPDWTPALPMKASVLLWNDQGLGDGLMFLRFAPLFQVKNRHIAAFVQAPLKRLAESMGCFSGVYTPEDGPQAFDAALALGSLPAALDLKEKDIWRAPYFPAQKTKPHDGPRRVGLVWAGNPRHANDANRSLKLEELAPLLNVKGVEWFSLQRGIGASLLAHAPQRDALRDLSPSLTDFAATSSAMAALDLVISVDTAPAHLAGALGKPVWILLPAKGLDWRWGQTGETTPWYPTAHLFRQEKPGDWSAVLTQIASKINANC